MYMNKIQGNSGEKSEKEHLHNVITRISQSVNFGSEYIYMRAEEGAKGRTRNIRKH